MERFGRHILGAVPDPDLRRDLEVSLRLRKVWAGALGEPLARALAPGLLRSGCLTVLTAHSAWLTEARFHEARLKTALAEALPDLGIERVKLRLGRGRQGPSERPAPVPGVREVDPVVRQEISGLVEAVADPELRSSLQRLFERASLGRAATVEDMANGD